MYEVKDCVSYCLVLIFNLKEKVCLVNCLCGF